MVLQKKFVGAPGQLLKFFPDGSIRATAKPQVTLENPELVIYIDNVDWVTDIRITYWDGEVTILNPSSNTYVIALRKFINQDIATIYVNQEGVLPGREEVYSEVIIPENSTDRFFVRITEVTEDE